VSCSVGAQVAADSNFRTDAPSSGQILQQKECQILEGMPDHVHMCIAIPPKHAVASVDRVSKRKERDRDCAPVQQGTKFHRRALVGSRLRDIDRGVRTGAGAPRHPRARYRGWQRRAILSYKPRRALARRLDTWPTTFEAAQPIRPPALRGVSDSSPLRHALFSGMTLVRLVGRDFCSE
jgi:hypothetical protein